MISACWGREEAASLIGLPVTLQLSLLLQAMNFMGIATFSSQSFICIWSLWRGCLNLNIQVSFQRLSALISQGLTCLEGFSKRKVCLVSFQNLTLEVGIMVQKIGLLPCTKLIRVQFPASHMVLWTFQECGVLSTESKRKPWAHPGMDLHLKKKKKSIKILQKYL